LKFVRMLSRSSLPPWVNQILRDFAANPRRIGWRACDLGQARQRGGARGQMQKLPTVGKSHRSPLGVRFV
jgi:hypothetical protein